jgi:dihydroorotate dehydrogenase
VRGLLRLKYRAEDKPVEAFGLHFANEVGLAAGYDKDGLGWRGLETLGFGHIEVGTVTLLPQKGNPRPRLFRLADEQGLINRMGFPGRGAEFLRRRLQKRKRSGLILGVNIGKNKDTPLERASQDYLELMRLFTPLADYLAVNVSSPNTVGLRRLQGRQELDSLLRDLYKESLSQDLNLGKHVPILVKLAPDLTSDALEVITSNGMDGVIATNTTVSREGLRTPLAQEAGGLSGKPLQAKSLEMVRAINRRTQGKLPVIGVGGIDSPDSARAMLEAGASLVQVYTGLIYQGPGLVRQIVKGLK